MSRPANPRVAELSLNQAYLRLIPDGWKTVLWAVMNAAWGSVTKGLDMIWTAIPPPTRRSRFPQRPSIGLRTAMRLAGATAARHVDPKLNPIRKGEFVEEAQHEAGIEFCIQWTASVWDALYDAGWLFDERDVRATAGDFGDAEDEPGVWGELKANAERTEQDTG